ncbi:MAG: hypothetical protein JW716_00645 [Candidatus Aenigmarchaeota archaeon]|nr:hypothetical protein [Candidatus Aenigmarchaeota archaeon]
MADDGYGSNYPHTQQVAGDQGEILENIKERGFPVSFNEKAEPKDLMVIGYEPNANGGFDVTVQRRVKGSDGGRYVSLVGTGKTFYLKPGEMIRFKDNLCLL